MPEMLLPPHPVTLSISRARSGIRVTFTLALLLAGSLIAAAPVPSDFTVTAPADGSEFRLSAARGRYVALHFLLKTECPVCLRHTRDYVRRGPGLTNVVQVFLKPDSEDEIRQWTAKAAGGDAPAPTVYRDPGAALATAYGIPDGYAFHGQKVHFPALILLNPEGREVFRYVGTNNADRLSFDRFTAVVNAQNPPSDPKP